MCLSYQKQRPAQQLVYYANLDLEYVLKAAIINLGNSIYCAI
jgi:hypothetical protein